MSDRCVLTGNGISPIPYVVDALSLLAKSAEPCLPSCLASHLNPFSIPHMSLWKAAGPRPEQGHD
jgi:hypothetical protein